jgi:serine/threonine protein kinase
MEKNKGIKLDNETIMFPEKRVGGYGSKICMGQYTKDCNSRLVIIKAINFLDNKNGKFLNNTRELEIIQMIINHPHHNVTNIIKIIKSNEVSYIVMDYYSDGDLSSILIKPLKESIAKFYFKQLVECVRHMHENKIMHRDLKPKNILLANNKTVLKLTDFGLAKNDSSMHRSHTICGSPLYMAPELLNNVNYDITVDIWALGIILYEMIFGIHPLKECKDFEELQLRSMEGICLPNPKSFGIDVSDECIDLLKGILVVWNKRLSIDQVLNHKWLKTVIQYESLSLKDMFADIKDYESEFIDNEDEVSDEDSDYDTSSCDISPSDPLYSVFGLDLDF